MNYPMTLTVATYDTEDAANKAMARIAAKFGKLAKRLRVEDSGDEWISRESWDVTLAEGTNAEGRRIWNFLMGR